MTYTVDGGDAGRPQRRQLELPKDGPGRRSTSSFDLPAGLAAGSHRVCLTVTGEDSRRHVVRDHLLRPRHRDRSRVVLVARLVRSRARRSSCRRAPPARPSFVAPDDGTYVFELTVTDGTGGTATDEVMVVVDNLDPDARA